MCAMCVRDRFQSEGEKIAIMSLLRGRFGSLGRVLHEMRLHRTAIGPQMRALTSLKIASDQSNVLATTTLQPHSAPFQENASALNALLQDLNGKVARICEGGGAKAVERHRKRNKLPPRERIGAFLDPGSPFLEFSQLAGFNLYGDSRSFLAPRLKQCDGAAVLLLRYFAAIRCLCSRSRTIYSTRWRCAMWEGKQDRDK